MCIVLWETEEMCIRDSYPVAETCALPGGHGNSHKGEEDAVCRENLAELFFAYVKGIYLVIVYDWPETRT